MGKLIQYCTEASKYDGEFRWQAAGMGYILVTDGGHLMVIDGGHGVDAEGILGLLEEYAGGKPVVDLWIITHPHGDHYFALEKIADTPNLRERVDIRRICFSIPESFSWMHGGKTMNSQGDLDRLNAIPPKLGAEVYTPVRDDRLEIDDFVLDFLFTWPNTREWSSPNALSLIFTVENCSPMGRGKRAMFVGDTDSRVSEEVFLRHAEQPERLKCDILQTAHHGLDGGSENFYAAVDAAIVLMPISASGAKDMARPEQTCCRYNRFAAQRALTVIRACTGTTVLDF